MLFFDVCGGQNRNIFAPSLWSWLVMASLNKSITFFLIEIFRCQRKESWLRKHTSHYYLTQRSLPDSSYGAEWASLLYFSHCQIHSNQEANCCPWSCVVSYQESELQSGEVCWEAPSCCAAFDEPQQLYHSWLPIKRAKHKDMVKFAEKHLQLCHFIRRFSNRWRGVDPDAALEL